MSTPQLPITVITHHETRRVAALRIVASAVVALVWLHVLIHHNVTLAEAGFGTVSTYMAVHAALLQFQMAWRKHRART